MRIRFNELKTQSNTIKVSFDNGKTYSSVAKAVALADGIPIDLSICTKLNNIIISGSKINKKPNIVKKNIQDFNRLLLSKVTVNLESLESLLSDISDSSPDNPVAINVLPSGSLWEKDELTQLNNIIKQKQVYVDLRPTDLSHVVYQDLVDELVNYEEEAFDPLFGELEGSYTSSNLETSNLKIFPNVFLGNSYLIGISIPDTDNYTQGSVFMNCTNLKHISFAGDKLWKLGVLGNENYGGVDEYYTWDGIDNFKYTLDSWNTVLTTEQDFINKLVTTGGQLMWYYDCWIDLDRPYDIDEIDEPKEPLTTEISLEGSSISNNIRTLSLGDEVKVDTVSNIIEDIDGENQVVDVSIIDYDESVKIENGIIEL